MPHQSLYWLRRTVEPWSQSSNLNGPVPTGLRQNFSTSSFTAFGEAIPNGLMAMFFMNGPWGSLSVKRTVYSSTASTLSITDSSSKPPNMEE